MTALAELPSVGQVMRLAQRRPPAGTEPREARESYGRALVALARRGSVPGVALSHLAVRVLLFLLGQRPGYFAHQRVMASAVESNLTSVRRALFELRDAGLVTWDLIPPHHPLPTGNYTRTNVNRYFIEADTLLRAVGERVASDPPRRVVSTRPDSGASTGTDPRSEQDPPLPPKGSSRQQDRRQVAKREIRSSISPGAGPAAEPPDLPRSAQRPKQDFASAVGPELADVLNAWRSLKLDEPDDRSVRALRNRRAEGATFDQLMGAVLGAKDDEWLRCGRAKAPFAVVFASLDSVARFAASGKEREHRTAAAARQRRLERHRALHDPGLPYPAENRGLATAALGKVLASIEALKNGPNPFG